MENKEIVLGIEQSIIFERVSDEEAGIIIKNVFSKLRGEKGYVLEKGLEPHFMALESCIRKKKKKYSIKKKDYSDDVVKCYNNCLKHFPEHLRPTEEKKHTWLDTIEKLNRIDNVPFDVIEFVVEKTRNNDFWSKNFLSLTKLRKKNKEDIMYIVVFNERIGNGTRQSKTNTVSQEYVNGIIDKLQS